MLSILVLWTKIVIGKKNGIGRSHFQKDRKSESAEKIAIGASLIDSSVIKMINVQKRSKEIGKIIHVISGVQP